MAEAGLTVTGVLIVAGALVGSWWGTRTILTSADRWGLLDQPGDRSLHTVPTPRGGGIPIGLITVASAAILATVLAPERSTLVALAASTGVIAWLGWKEDRDGLSIRFRLAVQVLVATALVLWIGAPSAPELFGVALPLGAVGTAIFVMWVVWLTNLYNFMDGIDGLAGGQGVLCGGVWGFWFAGVGAPGLAIVCWSLAAACAGFLVWNWFPARIFLGDCGSLAIGFSLAGLSLAGIALHGLPWSAFALSLGIFIADATWTLAGRMVRGEAWWLPHRSHFYQRAVAAGLSHRLVTTTILASGVLLAFLGTLEAGRTGPRPLWAVLGLLLLLVLALSVRVTERKEERPVGSPPP